MVSDIVNCRIEFIGHADDIAMPRSASLVRMFLNELFLKMRAENGNIYTNNIFHLYSYLQK